jgi:hypothetical protein
MLVLVVAFNAVACQAASEYTHAVIAELWFRTVGNNYTKAEKQSFMLGTLFPDARYLDPVHMTKERTHDRRWAIPIEDVYNAATPFEVGFKLHSWVDLIFRLEEKKKPNDMVGYVSNVLKAMGYDFGIYADTVFKLTLDQIFYQSEMVSKMVDCKGSLAMLDDVDAGEKAFTSETVIRTWHTILGYYFTGGVNVMLAAGVGVAGQTRETLSTWSKLVVTLADDPKIVAYAMWLLDHAGKEFTKAAESKESKAAAKTTLRTALEGNEKILSLVADYVV